MKNKWVLFLSIVIIAFFGFMIPVHADGRTVTDYDEKSEYSEVRHELSPAETTLFVLGIITFHGVVGFIIYLAIVQTREKRKYEISEEELKEFLPGYTLDSLKEELYKQYISVQNAYSSYQFDQLDQLCHNTLSREYKTQLSSLREKHGTNVMNDFELLDIKVQGVSREAGNIIVKLYLKNRYIDYTVDDQNNLLRGDYQHKIEVESRLVFCKRKEVGRQMHYCPKCGSELNDSKECSSCGHVVAKKNKFILKEKGAFV